MKIAICDDVVEQISAVKSIISQKIEEEIEFFTYSNGNDLIKDNKVNMEGIDASYFLLGLLSAFDNRFQAV